MQVVALPISIAKQSASTAASPPLSSSFGVALASSIFGSLAEHLPSQSRVAASASNFSTKSGAESGTSVDFKFGSGASSNSGKLSSKSTSKTDAKAAVNCASAPRPAITLLPTETMFLQTALLPTPPAQSPADLQITVETLTGAPSNLGDASSDSDQRWPVHQLSETLVDLSAPSLFSQLIATDPASSAEAYAAKNRTASGSSLPGELSTTGLKDTEHSSKTSQGTSSSANVFPDASMQTSNTQTVLSTSLSSGAPAATDSSALTTTPLTPAPPMRADSPILTTPTGNPNLVLPPDPAFDTSPPVAFIAALATRPASIAILQSSPNVNPALLTEFANAKSAATPKSTDSNVSHSMSSDTPAAESATQAGSTAAGPVPAIGPAGPEANLLAAQTTDAPETGFAISNPMTNNASNINASLVISNSISHSNASASISPISDAPSTSGLGSAQPLSTAASPAPETDKRSTPALQAAASSSTTTQSADSPWHDVAVPAAPVAGSSAMFTIPIPAPPASSVPPRLGSDPTPTLPQTHQMLDSAPPAVAPPTVPAAGPAVSPQMNAQMHVGLRTEAFGAVEIHTIVQQSQIGITVHADHDISRWFTSEVPGLETGLNHQHLNLVGIDFDSGGSGVQTASSFQHGQPRQHSSETHGSQSRGSADQGKSPEPAILDTFPAEPLAGYGLTRVNIHA